jgi:hypothetical protein
MRDYNILTKYYPDDKLLLLYNKFTTENRPQLERDCRSIVLNTDTFKIVNYSCPTPIYNNNAVRYLLHNQDKEKHYYTCYEGSFISLFYTNNTWFFSSRRNIFKIGSENNSPHYKMFCEVLEQDCLTIDNFVKTLDNNKSYHFVLIHYLNKNIVNYEKEFGNKYKRLCFLFSRDNETQEESEYTFNVPSIFTPVELSDDNSINMTNDKLTDEPTTEGIIVKIGDKILKLQNIQYQFYKAIGKEQNLFRGFIHLYQNNKLVDYFNNNNQTKQFKKIVNPIKTNESYDTVGTIDAVFKVITSELYELFNVLFDDKTGKSKNNELYNILPSEYKTMLYHLRKIFFINNKKGYPEKLSKNNIYYYLKNVEVIVIEKFLKIRKLMLNTIRVNTTGLNKKTFSDFGMIVNCKKKILNKLCAIYTTKMFPEIMPDDIIDL